MIVAALGEKGGTGKTTIAVNLAGMRSLLGSAVLLLDADRQGSATYWLEARKESGHPAPVGRVSYNGLIDVAREAQAFYDDIVIDVGAGDAAAMRDAFTVSDAVLTPVKPAGVDMWTMGLVDELAEDALPANPRLQPYVVLNMAPPYTRNTDTNEALNALAELEVFKVAPPILRQRIAFARSTPLGMVVSELGPNAKKAAYEMQALYDLLYLDGKVE
jgi:chromosome partitioning protein